MVIHCVLPASYSGFLHGGTPYMPSKFPAHYAARVDYQNAGSLMPRTICRMKIKQKCGNHIRTKFVMSAARNDHNLSFDDDLPQEPFWLSLIKDVIWDVKSLVVFLVEQPSQLKYIEWPSFGSTLRTATLTLVLVALLIVALSSVDSALCYLLALVLRKSS